MRRLLRLAAATALTAAWLVALPCGGASACSCAQSSDAEVYDGATAVFVGTALGATGEDPQLWTFATERADKGEVDERQEVALPLASTMCGFSFVAGGRYQVFAYEFDGKLYTDHCSGNRNLSAGEEPFDRARPETDSQPAPVVPSPAPPPPAPAAPLPASSAAPETAAPSGSPDGVTALRDRASADSHDDAAGGSDRGAGSSALALAAALAVAVALAVVTTLVRLRRRPAVADPTTED